MHGTPHARVRQTGRLNWRAAMLLGLASSTYSTLMSQMAASRLGRDPWVDWMSVAAIPAREWALQLDPGWAAIAAGVAFHQWADVSWALVFFGVFGRWTARLRPTLLAIIALPWAVATSSLEWLFLVPVFPFAQPIFTLQQPYWIGFMVHLSSALLYPGFTWIRWNRAQRQRLFGGDMFIGAWAAGIAGLVVAVAVVAALGAGGHEVAWRGGDNVEVDRTFMRHMRTHHEQGITIAKLGADPRTIRTCGRWRG